MLRYSEISRAIRAIILTLAGTVILQILNPQVETFVDFSDAPPFKSRMASSALTNASSNAPFKARSNYKIPSGLVNVEMIHDPYASSDADVDLKLLLAKVTPLMEIFARDR